MPTSPWRTVTFLGALVVGASMLAAASTATADVPSPAITTAFDAPRCAGATDDDPAQATSGGVSNLLSVFGDRLASYNAGDIVPLYDSFGSNVGAYPPICGVRYVASVGGPVSEWMFCTDLTSHVCGDTRNDGQLLEGSTPVDPLERLTTNPKLTASQEKVIAYLVQQGHSYNGTGNQSWGGVTTASSSAGTNERTALQSLIWCVSDTPPAGSDLETTCANSMDAAEQARILALVPSNPTVTLDFDTSGGTLTVGDTAEFNLTTNLFDQPIGIATSGTATVTMTVCQGTSTLVSGVLTVPGNGSAAARTVTLCSEATTAGTLNIAATAAPASTTHIGWNQSPTKVGGVPCQVFAAFYTDQRATVSDTATANFAKAAVITPKPTPTRTSATPTRTSATPTPTRTSATPTPVAGGGETTLPETGASASPLAIGLVGFLIIGGAALTYVGRRVRKNSSSTLS